MGLFRDMFRTAGEVASLTRQCVFYENENERLRIENALLTKEIRLERGKKDKIAEHVYNLHARQAKLPMVFQDEKEKPKREPEIFSEIDAQKIEYYAKAMQRNDEGNVNPLPPLEIYVEAIKNNKELYPEIFS